MSRPTPPVVQETPPVRMTPPKRKKPEPAPGKVKKLSTENLIKKIAMFGGLGIGLLAIIIFLTCFMSEDAPLSGYAWTSKGSASNLVYAFIDDENGYIERRSEFVAFTYTTDGDKLIIRTEEEETLRYRYSVEGKQLVLKDLDGNQDKTLTRDGKSETGVPFICQSCNRRTVGKKHKAKQDGETVVCCADCKERLTPVEEEP